MPTNQNGRNAGTSDENRPSWRPQDQNQSARGDEREYRGWRERERDDRDRSSDNDRDESWRQSEHYGQGQSGYTAGRLENDRSLGQQNRNQTYAGRQEDRRREPYTDDRFTGRGGTVYWEDRGSRERMGHQRGNEGGSQQHMGYQTGPYGQRDDDYREGQGFGRSNMYGMGHEGVREHRTWERPEPDWRPETRRGGGHRGKGPAGYARSDDRIRENICEALTDDDQIDARDIEIVVHDGEVTLTGIVDDRETKRLAEDCVWQIGGVKEVQNHLRLRPVEQRGNPSASGEVTKHELAESRDRSAERRTRSSAEGDAKVDDKSAERRTRSSAEGDAKVDDKKHRA